MIDPDAVFTWLICGVFLAALWLVPRRVLRRYPRRRRPVVDGLAVRPRVAPAAVEAHHRW
ncbi:MAG TPA: hypothetical protein VN088_06020 [Nocardioides sp.]|nr:hypothetical protein [Nocardioides sp.]